MKKMLCMILSLIIVVSSGVLTSVSAAEDVSSQYNWGSVPVGAGGYVTGLAAHPSEPDLVYCRTDVGGAYRWDDNAQQWIPLTDMFGVEEDNLYGIGGIAIAPSDPEIVYLAAGKYQSNVGAVLKSTNRGNTWTKTNITNARFDGNGAYRNMGECIAVDPVNSNIVLVGTATGLLYKTTDGGLSWTQVHSADTHMRIVAFDSSSSSGSATLVVYAVAAGKGLYKSTNGGSSWTSVSGAPNTINRLDIIGDGTLYAAASNGLFRFKNNTWTNISPQSGEYKAVSVDPKNANRIVCVGPQTSENYMNVPIWESTDNGVNWKEKRKSSTINYTKPWMANSSENGDYSSNTADVLIDPTNPQRVWFCDFAGVYKTDNISSDVPVWEHAYQGMEEVVPRCFACPENGIYRLLAGIADVDGMAYADYKEYPQKTFRQIRQLKKEPWQMSSSSVDYCNEDPNIVVRVGIDWNSTAKAELSLDNTLTWHNITFAKKDNPSQSYNVSQFGLVAVSATKNPDTGYPAVVVIPKYGVPLVSLDMCTTWEEAKGITDKSIVTDYWNKGYHLTSDKVNGAKFYIQDRERGSSKVYVSEDWGRTWKNTTTLAGDWNQDATVIKAAPYMDGEVWSCTLGTNLYRSSDSGKSFKKIANVSDIVGFGFGKNAPDRQNPTVFLYGRVNGQMGVYRSVDMGTTWQKISDVSHGIGCSPKQVEGDLRTFGVVYIGTDGRGIFYGEPKGTTPENTKEYYASLRDGSSLNGWTFYQSNSIVDNNGYKVVNRALANKWSENTAGGRRDNIYTAEDWTGNYIFGGRIHNNASNSGNIVRMYFNWQDMNNYYCVEFPAGFSQPSLKKVEDGVETVLAQSQHSVDVTVLTDVVIYEESGKITVFIDQLGTRIPLLQAKDNTFLSGKVGLGSQSTEAKFMYPYVIQSDSIILPEYPSEEGEEPEPPTPVMYRENFGEDVEGDWNLNVGDTAMMLNNGDNLGFQGDWSGYRMAILDKYTTTRGFRFSADMSLAYGGATANDSRMIFNYTAKDGVVKYYSVIFQGGIESANPKVLLCKTVGNDKDIKIAEYPLTFSTQTFGKDMIHHITVSCENLGEITVDFEHSSGETTRLFDRVKDTVTSISVWTGGKVGVATKNNSTLFNNITLEQSPVMIISGQLTADGQAQCIIQSNFSEAVKGNIIVAAENEEGRVLYVNTVPFSLDADESSTFTIPVSYSGTEAPRIKCYYWSGDGQMIPLTFPDTIHTLN